MPNRNNATRARYVVHQAAFGWSVIDTVTDTIAIHEKIPLTGLAIDKAEDWADLLSLIHVRTLERNEKQDLG